MHQSLVPSPRRVWTDTEVRSQLNNTLEHTMKRKSTVEPLLLNVFKPAPRRLNRRFKLTRNTKDDFKYIYIEWSGLFWKVLVQSLWMKGQTAKKRKRKMPGVRTKHPILNLFFRGTRTTCGCVSAAPALYWSCSLFCPPQQPFSSHLSNLKPLCSQGLFLMFTA